MLNLAVFVNFMLSFRFSLSSNCSLFVADIKAAKLQEAKSQCNLQYISKLIIM